MAAVARMLLQNHLDKALEELARAKRLEGAKSMSKQQGLRYSLVASSLETAIKVVAELEQKPKAMSAKAGS